MKYYLVALILFFAQARCQINKSSDLNCKFNTACRWRNETNKLEYGGEFLLDSEVKVGRSIIITAKDRRESELFAVTHANYFGEQKAALISDLIGCQIGGATMTLWYYRTGRTSVLKACIREPPGSVDLSSYTCFPLTNKKHNLRWIFSAIEFPPIAQPFELIIEATFVEPNDLIAIDDITFNATLCGSIGRSERGVSERILAPPMINYQEWEQLRKSETNLKRPTMLVVADTPKINFIWTNGSIQQSELISRIGEEEVEENTNAVLSRTPSLPELSPIIPLISRPILDFRKNLGNSHEFNPSLTISKNNRKYQNDSTDTENQIDNLVSIIRRIAPVVPAFLQAFQQNNAISRSITDDRTKSNSLPSNLVTRAYSNFHLPREIRRKLQSSGSETTISVTPSFETSNEHHFITVVPRNWRKSLRKTLNVQKMRKNQFGMERRIHGVQWNKKMNYPTTEMKFSKNMRADHPKRSENKLKPKSFGKVELSTNYGIGNSNESKIIIERLIAYRNENDTEKTVEEFGMDPLDDNEINKLMDLHKKIFVASQAAYDSQNVRSDNFLNTSTSEINTTSKIRQHDIDDFLKSENTEFQRSVTSNLPKNMRKDLEILKKIPNAGELLKGLDLNLINEPKGFLKLKKTVIERYLLRKMGLFS